MTTTPAPVSMPALDRFFAALRRSPVTRSQDRVFAGVAAGIADRLGVSRAIVRVAMVVLALLGPGVLLYLLAWLVLPDPHGHIRLEGALRGGEAGSIVLLVLVLLPVLSIFFAPAAGVHGHGGPWGLLLVGAIALIGFKKGWWQGRVSRPATPLQTSTPPTSGPQDAPHA